MHHLTVLLTGLLAGTASASIITSDADLDLTVTGTNLDYADVGGSVSSDGPRIGASLQNGHGGVFVSITLISYLTITGGTGSGAIPFYGAVNTDCDGTPFAAVGACNIQLHMPNIFTFDTPMTVLEHLSLGINEAPLGRVSGGISGVLFVALDSQGNQATNFNWSATNSAAVNNPEPGTWVLLTGAGAMLLWFKRKKAGHPVKDAPLVR